MPRNDYQQQLDQRREDVLEINDELAESVITGDHEISRRYLDLERDCIELLTLQQPVAGDLRFIAASFKSVTDLYGLLYRFTSGESNRVRRDSVEEWSESTGATASRPAVAPEMTYSKPY